MSLHIVTYNIHKGFSQFNRKMMVHELKSNLLGLKPDIVFLQEVQGLHLLHSHRHATWPQGAQHEFLAGDLWESAYGKNVIYDHGHHGNALLSRYPIVHSVNQDVTHLKFERRGILHTQVQTPLFKQALHCVCLHLSLLAHSRKKQLQALAEKLEEWAPGDTPLIIAGDFNDWRNQAHDLLAERLGLNEVFVGLSGQNGRPAKSFPAHAPLFRLDRIYIRGLFVQSAAVHSGPPWSGISDHAALSATLTTLSA